MGQDDQVDIDNLSSPDQTSLNTLLQQAERAAGLLSSGHLSQGEAELDALLRAQPSWGLGWKLRAAFLVNMARHEEAFHAVRMAAQYLPPDAELFNIAGTLLRDIGQIDQAIGGRR